MTGKVIARRSFVKIAAATSAAISAGMVYASPVLAELSDSASPDYLGSTKRIRTCCRACGKMECGVWVTIKDGRAIRVEGDETACMSAGNCCSKSQSSIQATYHPDRIYFPMKRTNPKDSSDPGWMRITWDEAFSICGEKFNEIKQKNGGESIFGMGGTSRVWCMCAYGVFSEMFDTPNMIVPWQVCKGPRHFATGMQSQFAFSWQATVDRPRVVVRWGSATELSNYDDSCRTTVDSAMYADNLIVVDPRLANLGKEADYWQHLRPGTDAALALAWCNVVIENNLIDDLFVKKWTNGPFLVCDDIEPSGFSCNKQISGQYDMKTTLLKESDIDTSTLSWTVEGEGSPYRFLVWDDIHNELTYYDVQANAWRDENWVPTTSGYEADQKHLFPGVAQGWVTDLRPFDPEIDPALFGEYEVKLKNGKSSTVRPVFDLFAERCATDYSLEKASQITGISAEEIEEAALCYATRLDPASGYGNGGIAYMLAVEHGCNSIQNCRALDILCGITGNWDTPGGQRGATASYGGDYNFFQHAPGLPPISAEQYLKQSGCQEFPLLQWWQWWADAASCYQQMESGNPYPIVAGICQSGDFMNMANSTYNWDRFTNLDFFVTLDLWHTPLSGKADLLLPCTHWIETDAPRPSQGSAGALGANVMCVEPPADVMYDPQIMIGIAKAMGLPISDDPDDPWPTTEKLLDSRYESIGMTWKEFVEDFEENGWWSAKNKFPDTWGTYRRFEAGGLRSTAQGNISASGGDTKAQGLSTPTSKMEIWSTVVESFFPDREDCMPNFVEPPQSPISTPEVFDEYPFTCNTGRRIPVYFHSEHRQLPWCRELWPVPRMEINPADAAELGIKQGDWCWIENEYGKVRQVADIYPGIKAGEINCEHQWWYPELNQSGGGFELSGINCLVPQDMRDRHCGSSFLRAYAVKVYKATSENSPNGNVVPCGIDGSEIIHTPDDRRLKEWAIPNYEGRDV